METLEALKVSEVLSESYLTIKSSVSEIREETKEKIIEEAEVLFLKLGIRSVTMEDVARELSMSKKTLYQFFDNKEHLVLEVVKRHLTAEAGDFTKIAEEAENAIDELYRISKCMRRNMSNVHPVTLHDLRKYHPKAFELFSTFKNEFIRGNVENNLKRGIAEGYYRTDIDPEILAILRVEQVVMMFDHKLFPNPPFDFIRVQMQMFDHFIHGVLSEKGKELYDHFQQQSEVN